MSQETLPMILVQVTHITWTKNSRGAPGATGRNSVRDARSIRQDWQAGTVVVESESWSEVCGWQAPSQSGDYLKERAEWQSLKNSAWNLRLDGTRTFAIFQPSFHGSGAPGFESYTLAGNPKPFKREFEVPADRWVRLRWNGRFSNFYDGGPWWYEKTTVNIANFTHGIRPDIFLTTEPAEQFERLAVLR